MARHPKPKNARNALRQLRECLSEKGPKPPIAQDRLSEITGIPTNTIRQVEAGTRPLTRGTLSKVLFATSAEWNNKKKHWMSFWPDFRPPARPFSFAIYEEFRKQSIRRPTNDAEQVGILWSRMSDLFTKIPDSRWWDLYFRVESLLESCRQDFRLPLAEEIYRSVSESMTVDGKNSAEAESEFLLSYQERLAKAGHQKKGWRQAREGLKLR